MAALGRLFPLVVPSATVGLLTRKLQSAHCRCEQQQQPQRSSAILRVALVRHGESQAQVQRLIGRNASAPLSDEGVHQAELLGSFHANALRRAAASQLVVASDATRAVQTAQVALGTAKATSAVASFAALTEIWRGDFEGTPLKGEAMSRWQRALAAKTAENTWDWRCCNGSESMADVSDRMLACLEQLTAVGPLDDNEDATLWIFSHSVAIRSLIWHLLGCSPEHELIIANTSVTHLERTSVSSPWRVMSFNDTQHLEARAASSASY